MTRESLDGAGQRLIHAAGLAGGWALFAYWWYVVAVANWDQSGVALIIFVTLVVSPAITLAWVLHNLGIFHRKGPRLDAPKVAIEYTHDWNGRLVVADWAQLRDEPVVAVTVAGSCKLYRAGSPAPEPVATPAPAVPDTEPA